MFNTRYTNKEKEKEKEKKKKRVQSHCLIEDSY